MKPTIEEKLGQLFIVRFHGKEITDELISLIRDYHIGGVALYYCNYSSYDEMQNLINEIKRINSLYNKTPIFIAIDQEGGRVNRLPKEFKNLPVANKLTSDIELVKESGQIIGEILNDIGVRFCFAPVLDIQRFKDNHAIGDRCYGRNSKDVTTNGIAMMNELKKNVLCAVKHFPGHGMFKSDYHIFLVGTTKNISKTTDIIPFEEAIKEGTPAIMVGHIMVRRMDNIYPASLSKKVIKEFLIKKLGYNGLIVTDDLKMKAISIIYGYKRATLKAVEAGNTNILIGAKYNNVMKCLDYIKKRINPELEEDINNAYNKVISAKKKYKLNDEPKKPINIEKYNKRIQRIRDIVLK